MTLDFSKAPTNAPSPEDDLLKIRQYLIDTIETWLPKILPGARNKSGQFRAGNLQGEPGSSLVIQLSGSGRGLWMDHATGEKGDIFSLIQAALNVDFTTALEIARDMANIPMRKVTPKMLKMSDENKERYTREQMSQIIRETQMPQEAMHQYLRKRCIDRGILPPDLRFHPDLLHYPSKTRWPSMVALVRDVEGKIIGLHRTYIDPTTFQKADVEPNKMMLGKCRGGAVRLMLPVPSMPLGISEGIETGLAAMQMLNIPVWAALSTTGVRNIVLPTSVNDVVIFADAGEHYDEKLGRIVRPGEEAAQDLSWRLVNEGRRARIVRPKYGDDFNDDLLRENDVAHQD